MKKTVTIREIQNIEYDILKAFDLFCKNNNIKYSLAFGTMLGAVRHEGFIPWDDDIDVFIFRSEYKKLIELTKDGVLLNGRYKVMTPNDDDMPYAFIKVVDTKTKVKEIGKEVSFGAWIDVFPLDYCGNDLEKVIKERKKWVFYTWFIFATISLNKSLKIKNILKKIILGINKIFGHDLTYYKNKLNSIGSKEKTKYISAIVNPCSEKEIFPTEYFEKGYTELKFEDSIFPVFSDYDEILKWNYGDYMTLPPENEREGHCSLEVEFL